MPGRLRWLLAAAALLVAAPARGQKPALAKTLAAADSAPHAGASADASEPIKLVYDREIFVYPSDDRRDPFTPLAGGKTDGIGPRFEDLTLRGVIYARGLGGVALIQDATGKIYRVHEGDSVGNARVVSIDTTSVVFDVLDFGASRRRVLQLKHADGRGGVQP
jgi:hypothetical protein